VKVLCRPQFLADVEDAADYLLSEAGDQVVNRWRRSLKSTIRFVRRFPQIGRLRGDLPLEGIRTFFLKGFPNWLIFYRVRESQIEFLRVKHGMMHLPGLFEEKPADE
jgi:plasmid stabilization system protein ParE